MILRRTSFFGCLFLLIAGLLLSSKLIWLMRSEQTTGYYGFMGQGNALEQIRVPYSQIYFPYGKDTVWFKGPAGLKLPSGTPLQVRFRPDDPGDAKVLSFLGIWGNTAVYGGIVLLILLAVFLHPDIVPRGTNLKLTVKRPFVVLVN